jgi:hypothetical protein
MGATRIDPSLVRGWGRLAFEATAGLATVVEGMHHNISRAPGLLGPPAPGRTRGITGLVYASIRGVAQAMGWGLDAALAPLSRAAGEARSTPEPEAIVAALNGVVGDHLAATGNPLAIPMRLRCDGRTLPLEGAGLAAALPGAGPRVAVLVHGLCMTERRWSRRGHDHGAALARDLGFTPVYLHYNTGLHVSTNGRALAALLERLVEAWPVPVEDLTLLGHSLGGLVARSACHHAEADGLRWRRRLRALVCLGAPHHGAALERGGNAIDRLLGASPYTASLARLGKIRSAGITDLRHGSLLDDDWAGRDRFARAHAPPGAVPLPARVRSYAVAATRARRAGVADGLVGDGLVPLPSALGRHADPARALAFPERHTYVARGASHFDLLSDPRVYERLRRWLAR